MSLPAGHNAAMASLPETFDDESDGFAPPADGPYYTVPGASSTTDVSPYDNLFPLPSLQTGVVTNDYYTGEASRLSFRYGHSEGQNVPMVLETKGNFGALEKMEKQLLRNRKELHALRLVSLAALILAFLSIALAGYAVSSVARANPTSASIGTVSPIAASLTASFDNLALNSSSLSF